MKIRRHLAAATLLAASSALVAPAFAHESRVLPASTGGVRVTVGFLAEPAFEDSHNGLDLFLFTFDKRCPSDPTDFYGNPITKAEIKSITAEALYFDKSEAPGGTLGKALPTKAKLLKSLLISDKSPVAGVFNDSGHYHSWYKPTHPGNPEQGGAYGFHVKGEVETVETEWACEGDTKPTKIPARKASFDTYWVCEAGFRDPKEPEARGAFNCIDPVQVFPGKAEDGYEPNKTYSSRGGRNY